MKKVFNAWDCFAFVNVSLLSKRKENLFEVISSRGVRKYRGYEKSVPGSNEKNQSMEAVKGQTHIMTSRSVRISEIL